MERIEIGGAKEWLSVADICAYMEVTPYVVTSLLRAGEIPAVKFGRVWRVSKRDLEDWINVQRGQDV
ncbi:MAG: helix-turn-helix domain-containing protein [Actinobacteria bacterium]|nr:helix-turn-helix domain-containing protein [Actinomycetota bacterium]